MPETNTEVEMVTWVTNDFPTPPGPVLGGGCTKENDTGGGVRIPEKNTGGGYTKRTDTGGGVRITETNTGGGVEMVTCVTNDFPTPPGPV